MGSCAVSNYTFNQTISVNTQVYDLRAAAIAAGWNGIIGLNATVTINTGIIVSSTSTSTPALTISGSFSTGSTIIIINNGTIVGKWGGGGYGGTWNWAAWPGSSGGPGLFTSTPVTIQNNGSISGGGWGGGGWWGTAHTGLSYCIGWGGGGWGWGYGIAGNGQPCGGSYPGGNGTAGIVSTGGIGWIGRSDGNGTSGAGGAGGSAGQAGATGINAVGWHTATAGGVGGAAGKSITGLSNVTFSPTGTINGPTVP